MFAHESFRFIWHIWCCYLTGSYLSEVLTCHSLVIMLCSVALTCYCSAWDFIYLIAPYSLKNVALGILLVNALLEPCITVRFKGLRYAFYFWLIFISDLIRTWTSNIQKLHHGGMSSFNAVIVIVVPRDRKFCLLFRKIVPELFQALARMNLFCFCKPLMTKIQDLQMIVISK